MRRRTFVVLAPLFTAFGMIVACSFPDVTFAPENGGAETGTDTATTDDASTDAVEEIVVEKEDAAPPVNPDACAATDCDCDDDGFLRKGCNPDGGRDANAPNSPDGSPWDCNDYDFAYRPFRTTYSAQVPGPDGGDYNCDGLVEKGFDEKGNPSNPLTCTGIGLTGCSGEGFDNTVNCGEEGNYVKCVLVNLIGCQPNALQGPKTQVCR